MLPADAGYVTYYANSLEEALSGAIRLVRHTSKVEAGHDPESWILVVDRDERLRRYFDPLSEGEYGALTQHVTFAVSAAEALTMLPTRAWSGLVILDPGEDSTEVLSAAQRHNTLRVIAESRAFGAIDAGRRLPAGDIFVFGENLTDFQVPFGSYSISQQAYRVWNNPLDAMAQTSTFAANATALTLVIENLRRHGCISQSHEETLANIHADRRVRNDYFRRFCNPSAADLMEAFGLDFDLSGADGGQILLRDGTTLLDCALGNGASLRGHNSPDMARELAEHDPQIDYTGRLSQLLRTLSGFDEMFPAVSGATSVENALGLAWLARPNKLPHRDIPGQFQERPSLPSTSVVMAHNARPVSRARSGRTIRTSCSSIRSVRTPPRNSPPHWITRTWAWCGANSFRACRVSRYQPNCYRSWPAPNNAAASSSGWTKC